MRSLRVPLLVLCTSVLLVGFTAMPTDEYVTTPAPPVGGPLLFAYRMPSPDGVDRIAWWAWNPTERPLWLASPAQGWAEVEGACTVWSSLIEPVPARAWQVVKGVVPMPDLVPVAGRGTAAGTFVADLPALGEDAQRAARPLVLRCGWFPAAPAARPETLEDYRKLLSTQQATVSNPLPPDQERM
jgi:hypothetical protein